MTSCFQRLTRKPMWMIGATWPLVLLTVHLPGIPRASVNLLPWRQELALNFLLILTLGFILVKERGTVRGVSTTRNTFIPLTLAALFVSWVFVSITWATDRYQALHLGLQWLSYLIFFGLMTFGAGAKVIRASFITLILVVWVLAIACAIESWFGAPLTDGSLRMDVKPLLRGSSALGEITGAACILFAAFTLHLHRGRAALMCGATAVAGWLATLQSLERAPLIGACVGLLLLFTGAFIRPSKRLFWRLGSLTAAFVLVLLIQAMPSRLTNHDVSTFTRLQQDLSTDANTSVRILFWGVGLEMVRSHPLLGVGANNYQIKYGEGRAQFSARYPNSPLVAMNDHLLTLYAHNEYVQMAAELGIIGLLLFALFSLALVTNFARALRDRGQTLPVLGAGGAMLAFGISSGASASSFRSLGGGLIFFFAAALVCRSANKVNRSVYESRKVVFFPINTLRLIGLSFCALMALSAGVFAAQAAGSMLQSVAEGGADAATTEHYYRASLHVYPANTGAELGYGLWLYSEGRSTESVPYLRHAVERGFNSSICYSYLAGAQGSAGDLNEAERTLATAVRVYPASVFLLVRHAAALARNGRATESKEVFFRALSLDSRAARGWRQLIDKDIDAAYVAAKHDRNIALPGELAPEAAVFQVLQENEQRFPEAAHAGWRARMRGQQSK
ncbi:MAG: O-antigen ligase family protein [Pyrinomonadaceae bacterium]|nr:O-antigen ligase family protein [Pyrinomonadaceae bacterium]